MNRREILTGMAALPILPLLPAQSVSVPLYDLVDTYGIDWAAKPDSFVMSYFYFDQVSQVVHFSEVSDPWKIYP